MFFGPAFFSFLYYGVAPKTYLFLSKFHVQQVTRFSNNVSLKTSFIATCMLPRLHIYVLNERSL
jgi:hypothetical protein